MKAATTTNAISRDICSQVEARLWQERERIYAEIHAYPPPIPACDAQFNYLIEKRAAVAQELSKVRSIDWRPDNPRQAVAVLRQIVKSSEILNTSAKAYLLEALAQ